LCRLFQPNYLTPIFEKSGCIVLNCNPPDTIQKIEKLNVWAQERDQMLAQMALAWLLKDVRLMMKCLHHKDFSADELAKIETILPDN